MAGLAVVAVLGVGYWFAFLQPRPGESVSTSGAGDHSGRLAGDHSGRPEGGYSTTPPTSGSHAPQAPPWGEQNSLSKPLQVHALEHGGVWGSTTARRDAQKLSGTSGLLPAATIVRLSLPRTLGWTQRLPSPPGKDRSARRVRPRAHRRSRQQEPGSWPGTHPVRLVSWAITLSKVWAGLDTNKHQLLAQLHGHELVGALFVRDEKSRLRSSMTIQVLEVPVFEVNGVAEPE